jgi:hypothetical protein
MNARRHLLCLLPLVCTLACADERDDDSDELPSVASGPSADDPDDDPDGDPSDPSSDDAPGHAREAACEANARSYSDRMTECYAADVVTDADVAMVCAASRTPQSVWFTCVQEVEAFDECGADVGCEHWYGVDCWDSLRAMMICFGEPDPGAEAPVCGYAGDGECDEPEGTGVCLDGTDVADCEGGGTGGGDAPSCDPSDCSGCITECDDFGCYQCCWSCNGSSCEQSCNF